MPFTFFLVIEGLDGSGKSEISRRLNVMLRQTMGDRVKLTFEPHDPSAAGLFIRRALSKQIRVSLRSLALAFALNRLDHNERVIAPFLSTATENAPRMVISDRYYLSSLVYQSAPDMSMEAVMELNRAARKPDLILFMDASAETCYQRMGVRGGDRELFEQNLSETRQKYQAAIAFLRERGHTIVTVNADAGLQDVLNNIVDVLNAHAPSWLTIQRVLLLEETAPTRIVPAPDVTIEGAMSAYQDVLREAGEDSAAIARICAEAAASMPADASAALFLHALRDQGYAVGEPLPWPDALAYGLRFTLPAGVIMRGAALILSEAGSYDAITRKLLSLESYLDELGQTTQFCLIFDPAHRGAPTEYEREGGMIPARIMGRGFIAGFLAKAAADMAARRDAQPAAPTPAALPELEDLEEEGDESAEEAAI